MLFILSIDASEKSINFPSNKGFLNKAKNIHFNTCNCVVEN